MTTSSIWSYQYPSAHEVVSAIIRRCSTNNTDVREAALHDLDLSSVKSILDLGCGFGFMSEALTGRIAPDARLVGTDIWSSNEEPFLRKTSGSGHNSCFVCTRVDSKLSWPDRSFDLVVCSYSLYFFVDVLPEIARILEPQGLFLTITHSESSVASLLRTAGCGETGSELLSLVRRFSAENGHQLLSSWFGEVTQIDYPNSLHFKPEHVDDLLTYLRFKLPQLSVGGKLDADADGVFVRLRDSLLSHPDRLMVEKNNAIFRCRRPLCH